MENLAGLLIEVNHYLSENQRYYGAYQKVPIPCTPENLESLDSLSKQAVLTYTQNTELSYSAFIFNRYKFDLITREVYNVTKKDKLKKYTKLTPPNILVYSPKLGVGIMNGKQFDFKRKQRKRNKRLLDALFEAGSQGVDRKKLKAIIAPRVIQEYEVTARIHQAVSDLRKSLGVKADVIQVRGGSAKLKARLFVADKVFITNLPKK